MLNWTYSQAKAKIESDLALREAENFVEPSELLGYFNEAIDEAEAEIHKLRLEDEYFLSNTAISLVDGTAEMELPSDIYASKIRRIIYSDGSTDYYKIRRMRGPDKFERIAEIQATTTSADEEYRYLLVNRSAAEGVRMIFYPTPNETNSDRVTMWYIRNANRLTGDDSVIDVPEFIHFILQFVKVKCLKKEGILTEDDKNDLRTQRKLMIDTLTEMVPDEDDTVPEDFTHYAEHE